MRAILCKSHGPASNLVLDDIPAPTPGPGEVLAKIAYVGLNFMDTLIIQNRYQVKPALPFSPGAEFSGRIVALGEGVSEFSIGDRISGWSGYNAAREMIALPASRVTRIPDGVSDEVAAGLMITYGTSLHALRDRGRLKPGETLAVLGASGGVGLAAVELGRILGAKVIACASSPEKLAFARQAGATETIDYSVVDLKDELKRLTGGRGVDVVYDPVGGDLSEAAVRGLAWRGRLLVVGFAAGAIAKLPLNLTLLKGCDVVGVYWGAFGDKEPEAAAQDFADLLEWAAEGKLSAHIHAVYPLEDAVEALGVLERREAMGKVLLKL